MPLGVLSGAGLGIVSTIPGECWDQAGFKECHAAMYQTARIECRAQSNETDACIVPKTDQYAKAGCKCVKKPKTTTYTPSPSVPSESYSEPGTFLGMSSNTLFLVAAAVGAYYLLSDKKKPATKG
jgi:hypothetical protein